MHRRLREALLQLGTQKTLTIHLYFLSWFFYAKTFSSLSNMLGFRVDLQP